MIYCVLTNSAHAYLIFTKHSQVDSKVKSMTVAAFTVVLRPYVGQGVPHVMKAMQTSPQMAACNLRYRCGQAALELPICLLALFIIFFFPMLDLAVSSLRANTIYSCARDAARVAARSDTFSSGKAAALSQIALSEANSLNGAQISTSSATIDIVTVNLASGGTPVRLSGPLSSVDSSGGTMYQMEVIVPGSVVPLVTLSPNLFGSIPGVTVPMTITASSREFAEHPAGLTQ